MSNTMLFLDFDGVICNSLPECYLSSLLAWNRIQGEGALSPAEILKHMHEDGDKADNSRREQFEAFRPYIRSGGDYIFLQLAISEHIPLKNQEMFDALPEKYPDIALDAQEIFQNCRRELLEFDKAAWLSLNPLYDHIKPFLELRISDPDCYILSTKPIAFILEILAHHGISWPGERTICSGKRTKVEIIDEIMDKKAVSTALFVDDQIDHFLLPHRHKIRMFLATWGYTEISQPDNPLIEPLKLSQLASRLT
jgi:phosphoglycolate phosphatase-like HAD superfamily hydrolase